MTIAFAVAMVVFALCWSFPGARQAAGLILLALPIAGYVFGIWRKRFVP